MAYTPARRAAITAAYRARLWAIRAEMMRRLEASWTRVREDDIRAGFATFVPLAVVTITAAQASSQTLTRAYIRSVSGEEPVRVKAIAGTSLAGSMEQALVGILPMILGMIGRGAPADEALQAGAGWVTRMADNETTRAVDLEATGQAASPRALGWSGHVNQPCDKCVGNEGPHPFTEEMVRHPNCRCDREVVYREPEPTGPATFAPGTKVLHRGQIDKSIVGTVVRQEGPTVWVLNELQRAAGLPPAQLQAANLYVVA